MICRLFKWVLILMPVALSGCLTIIDDSAIGEQKAESGALKAEVYRLRDQVTEMRQSLSKMEEELQSVQNLRNSEVKDAKSRIDEIDRSLKAIESSHDQLKKEIVDELAKKIEKLPGFAGGTSGNPLGKGGLRRQDGGKKESGYEHVVKPGESLSAIAEAYKVTPSVIIKANSLSNPHLLRTGQKLFIPE